MRASSSSKYARALMRVALSRGRTDEVAASVSRAGEFFASPDGELAARLLQSGRVPREEREGLLGEVASRLGLGDETRAVVAEFARARALGDLRRLAQRARELAERAGELVHAELRTARPLTGETTARIAAAAEHALGRPVELRVVEDPGLIGGVVLRAGNRIWDGSLVTRVKGAQAASREG